MDMEPLLEARRKRSFSDTRISSSSERLNMSGGIANDGYGFGNGGGDGDGDKRSTTSAEKSYNSINVSSVSAGVTATPSQGMAGAKLNRSNTADVSTGLRDRSFRGRSYSSSNVFSPHTKNNGEGLGGEGVYDGDGGGGGGGGGEGRNNSQGRKSAPKMSNKHRQKRVLDRTGYFHQSTGEWHIRRKGGAWLYAPFYWDDWFHSLLNAPTRRIFACLFVLYVSTIWIFAMIFLLISRYDKDDPSGPPSKDDDSFNSVDDPGNHKSSGACGMDFDNKLEAFYFSMSTMTTIGYGVWDYYFGDCYAPMIAICVQAFISITFDAVAIGLIFQRLSRVQKRARTIVFSNKGVIRRIRGRLYFMFQVSELRKHQLVEAHVRVYCCRHARQVVGKHNYDDGYINGKCNGLTYSDSDGDGDGDGDRDGDGDSSESDNDSSAVEDNVKSMQDVNSKGKGNGRAKKERRKQVETAYYQTHNVRLQHPDDELGALLLMSLPNIVVHRLDEWSPLMPPPLWWDEDGRRHVWRGCLPPNVDSMGRIVGFDDGDDDEEGDDESRIISAIETRKVAPGFPELLQRACDKEAHARVLAQSEYGLNRRATKLLGQSSRDFLGGYSAGGSLGELILAGSNVSSSYSPKGGGSGQQGGWGGHGGGGGEGGTTSSATAAEEEGEGGGGNGNGNGGNGGKQKKHQSFFLGDVRYDNQQGDKKYERKGSTQARSRETRRKKQFEIEQREINAFMKDREAELIVLVEGIDVMTSATLQARHSYSHSDIEWDKTFAQCVTKQKRGFGKGHGECGGAVIDFSKFHDLINVPADVESCPLVSNIG